MAGGTGLLMVLNVVEGVVVLLLVVEMVTSLDEELVSPRLLLSILSMLVLSTLSFNSIGFALRAILGSRRGSTRTGADDDEDEDDGDGNAEGGDIDDLKGAKAAGNFSLIEGLLKLAIGNGFVSSADISTWAAARARKSKSRGLGKRLKNCTRRGSVRNGLVSFW